MMDEKKWPTAGTKEWIFWRDGMTPEEFDTEYQYLAEHYSELQAGTYVPLWKQRKGQESDS